MILSKLLFLACRLWHAEKLILVRVMESLQLVKVRAQIEVLEVNLVVLEERWLCHAWDATRASGYPMLGAG